jgi:hypothetical protein
MIFISVRLNKDKVDVAEAEELSKKLILKNFFSADLSINSLSHEEVDSVVSFISSSIRINEKLTRISFCIDSNFAFLNVIPVDDNLSDQELNEHLLWEVSQYFPGESGHKFAVRGYKFGDSNLSKALLVGVRKEMISFIKAIAERLKLKISIIDIDHFASENCLRERISPIRSRYFYRDFILIGVKPARIDVSVFKNYEFRNYFYFIIGGESDLMYFVVKLINDNISAGFEKFVFYGKFDLNFLNFIRSLLGEKFSVLNPIDTGLFLDVKVEPRLVPEFAPNIGLMLRMLWSG